MIGRTIGNYVVNRQIGQGGMGVVYLAEHPRIRRQVAVKILLSDLSRDPQVVARFFNEAKAANEIHNAHIVDILDFGELSDGASYIIMEWLDGHSLADVIGDSHRIALDRTTHIIRGIGEALAAAHANGIVHRDLKPDNIFLIQRDGDRDFVKVLDFGIAKLLQNDPATEIKTQTGAIIGTPAFMAPEQCRGLPIDHRTDLYALGCITYRMLTGVLPFNAQALGELLLQHMTQAPTPLRSIVPAIPESVERAVLKALEKEPNKRWRDVPEFMAALGSPMLAVQKTELGLGLATPDATPSAVRPASLDTLGQAAGQAVPPTVTPSRRPILLGAGAAVALAIVVGFFVWPKHTPSSPGPQAQPPSARAATTTTLPSTDAKNVPTPATAAPPVAAEVRNVHVHVAAVPAAATIEIDGAKVANPFDGEFPSSALSHRISAQLPGHQSEDRLIVFDQDRKLDLELHPAVANRAPARGHDRKHADRPNEKSSGPEPPVYKGTRGKLITEFPE